MQDQQGFFKALFDFGFSSFITIKFIKLIYAILLIACVLGLAGGLLAGLVTLFHAPLKGLAIVLLTPIGAALYLVIGRIYLELLVVIFRIAENTSTLVAMKRGS